MKLIIAGSRTLGEDSSVISFAFQMFPQLAPYIEEIVSGCAKGIDRWGEEYASEQWIKVRGFPADWNTHGKKAGIIRNCQMGDYADALLAIWDGQSKGTKHMIDYMRSLDKPVYILKVETETNVNDNIGPA